MRKCLNIIVIVVVLALIIYFVPLPKKIDQSTNGVFWANANDHITRDCEVTVNGWYYCYLIKDNVFKGDISFFVADKMSSYLVPNMSLYKSPLYKGKTGALTVYDAQTNQMDFLGQITISGAFKEIFIQSEEWNIFTPAGDLEEALRLISGI